MPTQFPSQKSRLVQETAVQQSMLQQTQAAIAAQTDPAGPTKDEGLLQNTDLINPDATEDDIPPPAYGEIYGEIRNEKDGLGTRAWVADDGRVNISIKQSNSRLSHLLNPVLYQYVQSAQDDIPPPFPYIPASLGGEEGIPPPPQLNIVIQVVGSRGDVQPFVALGKILKETYGHRVRLATHPNFKDFVEENDLEFFSIGGDPSQLMAFMVKNPSLMPGFRSLMDGDVGRRRKDVAEYIQGCWRSCYKAGDGMNSSARNDGSSESSADNLREEPAARSFVADCIIANPPSFAHIHCAEKLGIPLHIMFTMPYSPTQAFPHPLANIQSSNADPQLTNYLSYAMIELLSWQGLSDIINRFREKCLGLDPVSSIWGPGMLQRLKIPHTYCWSPALIPKPKDWGPHISIAGFYFLNLASNYTPAADLQAFLDAGPPPVYIGFGSIVLDDPNAMTELIFDAVRKTGRRVLLSKGWGGMGADQLQIPDGVFMLGNVPHDWLFKHVSCVVHHGGAGTTAAGISAGRPTLIVPFFGDQPFWGAMVARAGAGPDPIPHKQLTADKLGDAINFCLRPESLGRAKELASKIAAERGSDMGAQSFHQFLEPDRLRCSLAPSRPAAWRVKRTKVRLSALAVCTLVNENLLNFQDLKLFRPQEHYVDEGPWDPISGGFTACAGALGGMMMGLASIPSETWKALSPAERTRKQAQASESTIVSKSEASHVGKRLNSSILPGQGEPSSSAKDPSNLFGRSTPPSTIGSGSNPDSLHGESHAKQDEPSRSRFRSRNESDSGKDLDMMRSSGMSKGAGRVLKAIVQAPVDLTVNATRGMHNMPKLWGDDTVRPQERVSDMKSGFRAVGREFGFGWYDGLTGLVTQPWKGAQKEGTSGFVKGLGKGIGGVLIKPFAGGVGIVGHMMQGVNKEVQKAFGSNAQSYIVASRVAQGHEEWLQSSDAEKEDVIVRWKLIQKFLKKGDSPDEMVKEVLEAQRKNNTGEKDPRQHFGRTASYAQSAKSAAGPPLGPGRPVLAMSGPNQFLEAAGINQTIRPIARKALPGGAKENADVKWAVPENVSQLEYQRREAADHRASQQEMRQAIALSEGEFDRNASEALEYEKQLKRVMAQSLKEQKRRGSDSEWDSDSGLDDGEDDGVEWARERSGKMSEKAAAVAGVPPSYQRLPPNDQGHLAGTTQIEFEAQNHRKQGEKTTREKTEEEMMVEYVKKQSLLETHYQNKGKGHATVPEDWNHEDLQKALKLSMQGHEHDAEYRHGKAPGT
ncbi:UDP-Glycosyltransferase/glycogen phosphorylase [Setomelanomma holmii]|uniref:UDP-Glycosyltransferase/glycogen phosphorylase n=1 Tax=Setomelanomma holmii TaxID=210430 RepID=A0A9P4LFW9_9PLEO|nr:UDP-Glycosyltransferase/glycogen phosphorylase [Setomelanomma holmii]